MAGGYDWSKIRLEQPLDATMERYGVDLKSDGGDRFKCRCPFHDERTPSCVVYPDGHFNCYGCGARGDVVDFVAGMEGVEVAEAARKLAGERPMDTSARPRVAAKTDIYAGIVPLDVQPETFVEREGEGLRFWNAKRGRWSTIHPSAIYRYRDRAGRPLGVVAREDFDRGGKWLVQLQWCELPDEAGDDDGVGLASLPFARPLPLYGAEHLKSPPRQVIVVEGEKCVDALHGAGLADLGIVAVTWPGGGKVAKHANWRLLDGLPVVVWPDADKPGWETALEIVAQLRESGPDRAVKLLDHRVDDLPEGWDAADAVADGMSAGEVVGWARDRVTGSPAGPENTATSGATVAQCAPAGEADQIRAAREAAGVAGSPDSAAELEEEAHRKRPVHEVEDLLGPQNPHFRILGHNGLDRAYYAHSTGQLVWASTATGGHTWHLLLELAPEGWWRHVFPECKGQRALHNRAVEYLFRLSAEKGPCDPEVRGCGAWTDKDGDLVFHLGDRVWHHGELHDPKDVNGGAVYQRLEPLGVDLSTEPATDAQGARFLDLCRWLRWEDPNDGTLVAGWIISAMLGGALKWRPHLWITGESGAGKSTVIEELIAPTMGKLAKVLIGGSSAAGVRNAVGQRSLPIIIDEQEGESQRQKESLTEVLAAVRAASSGGNLVKADTRGGTHTYRLHSSYLFSSINPQLQHQADRNRITQLVLLKRREEGAAESYRKWLADTYQLLRTERFGERLLARACHNFSTYLANLETFRRALLDRMEARQADQLAPMVAGAHLIVSTREVTLDQAKRWAARTTFAEIEESGGGPDASDGTRCLQHILLSATSFDHAGHTIRPMMIQLIEWAYGKDGGMNPREAADALIRFGIRIEPATAWQSPSEIEIATSNEHLARVLERTPWSGSWRQALTQIPRAEVTPTRYFPGRRSRAVSIPIDRVLEVEAKVDRGQEDAAF